MILELFVFRITGHTNVTPGNIFTNNRFQLTHILQPFLQISRRLQWSQCKVLKIRRDRIPIADDKIFRQENTYGFFNIRR